MESTGWRSVAIGLRETSGPTILYCGTIADGEFLKRVGETIVSAAASGAASGITVDTSAFNLNLSAADDTVQKALNTLDDLVTGGGVTDHGALTGLADDDHTQYALAGASRVGTISVELNSAINQDVTTDASPTWVTAKLSGLTDGYVPYHVSDAAGLANGPIWTDGTKVGIGTSTFTSAAVLAIHGTNASVNGPHIQLTTSADVYPVIYMNAYGHQSSSWAMDAYWDGVWRSSSAAGNFILQMEAGQVAYYVSAGVAAGSQILAFTKELEFEIAGYINIPTGLLKVGINDVTQGYIQVFGGSSGNPGVVRLYMSADEDTSYEYWDLTTVADDFVIKREATVLATLTTEGLLGINTQVPVARLEIEDGGTTASILCKITQDDASIYGLIVGNDTYSTTDTLGLRLSLGNTGSAIVENSGALDLYLRAIGTANASDVYVQAERNILVQDYAAGTPVTKATWDVINGRLGIGMAPVADLFQVGDGTNYSTFEADGTLHFVGTATVWKDVWVTVSADRTSGTNYLTFVTPLRAYVFGVNDNADFPSIELPHDYKSGTDLQVHVHWATRSTNAGDTGVKWQIDWTAVAVAGVFPAATTISAEDTVPGGTAEFTHRFLSIGTISGAGKAFGTQVKLLLTRIAAAGSAPSQSPYLLQVGLHYEVDTIGSRAVDSK